MQDLIVTLGQPYSSWAAQRRSPVELSADSLEYVRVNVSATLPDGTSVNPTTDVVAFAFLPLGIDPTGSTTWNTGSWFAGVGSAFTAQILVGPSALVLAQGDYVVWVKLSESPEVPVMRAGILTIS